MTIQTPEPGELFTIRVQSRLQTEKFVNTFLLSTTQTSTLSELVKAGRGLTNLVKALLHNTATIVQFTVSTFEADPALRKENFKTVTVNEPGDGTGDDLMPLDVVLRIRKDTEVGFPGRLELRAAVLFDQIEVSNGKMTLNSAGRTGLEAALDAALLAGTTGATAPVEMLAGGTADYVICLTDEVDDPSPRLVSGFVVDDVASRQVNNRYFRKQSTP